MPDRVLQNHYCVAALQQPLSYNGIMNLPASEQIDQPMASARGVAGPRRAPALSCRTDLVVAMLLAVIVLASACGVRSSGMTVAGHVNPAIGENQALSWVNCMRSHGEPNMPDPAVNGRTVRISIHPGDGVDPRSAVFTAASKACKHLTSPGKGSAAGGTTITPADQAYYLKAVTCMRSHGYPKFPDPQFQGNNVTFNSTAPIDTSTAQYQRALAICDKLIPAGLPDSGRNPGAS
jgi:hypothetical protein